MAVEDDPRFNEWKHVSVEFHRRRVHFEAIKTLPETHLLRRLCRKKPDEAQAAYEKFVSEQLADEMREEHTRRRVFGRRAASGAATAALIA